MRVVVDTNVWLDWLVFDDAEIGPLRTLVEARRLHVVASAPMRIELLQVLTRPKFAAHVTDVAAVLARFDAITMAQAVQEARRPAPGLPPLVCSDPDDQMFIELALHAGAGCVVTRDKALLRLDPRARRHHALRLLPPARLPEAIVAMADAPAPATQP